jgi:hypothetical protein
MAVELKSALDSEVKSRLVFSEPLEGALTMISKVSLFHSVSSLVIGFLRVYSSTYQPAMLSQDRQASLVLHWGVREAR